MLFKKDINLNNFKNWKQKNDCVQFIFQKHELITKLLFIDKKFTL